MTTQYIFQNTGIVDPRSITTFGVSSKESKNPIGFFGTGLKYAISVLLRLNCQITIHSGASTYTFDVENTRIRVDDFNLVRMSTDGAAPVPCGFTTELGKTWEAWQAFRELACNALDEHGTYWAVEAPDMSHSPSTTTVVVTGANFAPAWAERDQIILPRNQMQPAAACHSIELFDQPSTWMYYRGLRVAKLNHPALFTYNVLTQMDLTEDRTLKYDYTASLMACRALMLHATAPLLERAVCADKTAYEYYLTWDAPQPSATYTDCVTRLLKAFDPRVNPTIAHMVRGNNLSEFVKDEALGLDYTDTARLVKAKKFLAKMGFNIEEYPITVTEFLGAGVLGRAADGNIYISRRALMMGTKMLAGTVLEEYLHLKHHLVDETRQMQNFLLDALISVGERATRTML